MATSVKGGGSCNPNEPGSHAETGAKWFAEHLTPDPPIAPRGTVGTDAATGGTTWSLPCDMTGGSSGCPWVQAQNLSTYVSAVVGSLNSYGYTGVTYMYGPTFNAETEDAFDSADTGTLVAGVVASAR